MAIVNLKDVTVYAVFSKGFRVIEESTKDGKTYTQRFTVWSEGIGVAEGDVVSLSGFLSAKVSEWTKDGETRHSVELSLNSPRLTTTELVDPDLGAPEGDFDWQTVAVPADDMDAPF